jgi:predicted dehydrogenase
MKKMKSIRKLRVGVIGLGMGGAHAVNYKKHPGVELVALADLDEVRLKKRAGEFGVSACYTDAGDMLAKEGLDLVSIATPNALHKPLTFQALKAGCHVLCEKPMAMNAGEAREMIKAAKQAKRRLMINFSTRFNPAAWAMKKEVDSGNVGDIYFSRTVWLRRRGMPGFGGWFGQKKLAGGGPLIDLGVHRLDLALWLMGYPKPVWVMGSTYDHLASAIAKEQGKSFDVEDFAAAMIRFENGATLELEASWAGHIRSGELMETRVLGTKGGMLHTHFDETKPYEWGLEIYNDRNGFQTTSRVGQGLAPVPTAMSHLVDCILEDKPHMATGEEGLVVQELLDAIYASAAKGKPIQLG